MPANFGRRPFQTTGYAIAASADGHPDWKIGGITLASAKLPTNGTGSTLTLVDQTQVLNGANYLLLGTTMCRITGSADTITITGTPTGGTFAISVTANGITQTATVPYNATGAAVQTAIQALTNVGAGNATVTGSAGGPYTFTFPSLLGPVVVAATNVGLTGGTPVVTLSGVTDSTDAGQFAPYDSTASDGRQTLVSGDCFVLNETWLDTAVPAFPSQGTAHPAVFAGGKVDYLKLVLSTGQGSNALPAGYPAGPTLSAFVTAFPRISLVKD